jgi:hypothetical protein
MTESSNAPVVGYKPPAVSIRATYTAGDTSDELTVDFDQWDGDVAVITSVINALTEAKPGSDVQVDQPAGPLAGVRSLRPSGASVTVGAPAGSTVTYNAGSEAQA